MSQCKITKKIPHCVSFCLRQMSSSTSNSKKNGWNESSTNSIVFLVAGWNLCRRFTGVRGENSTAWEPSDLRGPWSSPRGGGGAIKANRRGPHQERHGGRTEEKSFPFNNAGADEVWSLKRKAKKVWACRETRSVLYWVSYFSLVTMITTYSLISRMIAVIKLNASSVRVLLNV